MDQTKTAPDAARAGVVGVSAGGGRKHDSGKPDLSLNPPVASREMALAFAFGEWKYAAFNFELGLSARRLLAAAKRHIDAVVDGAELDTDPFTKDGETRTSGAHHLGHALASIAMYLRCRELGTLIDDRSPNRPPLQPVLREAAAVAPKPYLFSLVHQATKDGVMRFRAYNFPDHLRGMGWIATVDGREIRSAGHPDGRYSSLLFLPGFERTHDTDEICLRQADGWSFDLVDQVVQAVRARAAQEA